MIHSPLAPLELMAAMWCGGREAVLVEDRLDRATKEAMSGVLSRINDCPYCEDMLISLVHSIGQNDLAERVSEGPTSIEMSPDAEPFLEWTVAVANGEWDGETMPMSRTWVDEEVRDLDSTHRDLARFALLVALAPYQVDDAVVKPVLDAGSEERFVRALAWASLTGARRIATGLAEANPELCSTG